MVCAKPPRISPIPLRHSALLTVRHYLLNNPLRFLNPCSAKIAIAEGSDHVMSRLITYSLNDQDSGPNCGH